MNEQTDQTLPNIAVITCHDLGRHLGCYGIDTVHSPNIDGLAAGGVRFARAFTVAPSCSPSRAGMATGRYPHSNGVMGLTHPPFGWDLKPDELHVAALLRAAGYETHLFGFQHVTPSISRLGFDRVHGADRLLALHEKAWGANVAATVVETLQGEPAGRPLYLEINLEETHRPFDQGGAEVDESASVCVPAYLPSGPASYLEMARFQGAIRQADDAVGAILRALPPTTLVVFASDHGIAMPRAKCTLYDSGIEIALIVRLPGSSVPANRVVDEMVSNIDVVPTLLEVAGAPVPATIQGHSFLPLLRGEPFAARTELHAEKTFHSYYDPMRAIRTERFKYIRNFETTFEVEVPGDIQEGQVFRNHVSLYHGREHRDVELYDLRDDPFEQRNLAGIPAYHDVERWLDGRVRSWMVHTDDPLLRGPIASPSYFKAWRTWLRGRGDGSERAFREGQVPRVDGDEGPG